MFTGNQASVRNVYEYLSDEDKKQFEEFGDDYRTLVSLEDAQERKIQAEKMVEKYGLDSNKGSDEPNPKVYMRNVSPDARKILSGEGNKTSEELRDTIENALGDTLQGATKGGKNVKQEVTTTSKPDIGGPNKEFIRTAEQDASVREIFSIDSFSGLDSSMHQLMGPTDESGNLVRYRKTDFYSDVNSVTEETVTLSALTKQEEYFGLVFKPEVDSEVFIDRGVADIFERHALLSEIKTTNDIDYNRDGFLKS